MKREHIALLGGAGLLLVFVLAGYFYKSQQAEELGAIARSSASPLEREYS